MTFPRITVGTVVKLLVASLVVGALMAWLRVTPDQVVTWIVDAAGGFFDTALANINTALKYVLLGAVIVVPIWLVWVLWQSVSRR